MSGDNAEKNNSIVVGAVREIVNSKAAERLADAVSGLVQLPQNAFDYLVGPDRIRSVNAARSDVAVQAAQAQAQIERIRIETGDFVFDREMHKTLNRRAILAEAQAALPPPSDGISDQPISKDFVHNFFDEFDGISDPDVHKIVGRLLANEVVRPGSFPRRTMRVLRDLESADFALFTKLCGLCWNFGQTTPLIYEPNDPIYRKHGLNFAKLTEIESLGLISFNALGYSRQELPTKFYVVYGKAVVQIELKDGSSELNCGTTILTDAGRRLATLAHAPTDPEFLEYVVDKWKAQGHRVGVMGNALPIKAV